MPAALEGLTIAEAAPRARFGVSVLAVKRMGRDGIERRFVPGPADRFEHGDVLVVLGTDEALASSRTGAPLRRPRANSRPSASGRAPAGRRGAILRATLMEIPSR